MDGEQLEATIVEWMGGLNLDYPDERIIYETLFQVVDLINEYKGD